MQIRKHYLLVIWPRKQVVSIHREPHSADFTRVGFEALDHAVASDIPKHHGGVFMSRGEQPARWVHTNSCKCTAWKYRHQEADEYTCKVRADSKFAPSQSEMALHCNDVSHWLGASLESALKVYPQYIMA